MVTTLLQHIAEMSTAVELVSPLFYFSCFSMCHDAITVVMNHVFCVYICCVVAGFSYRIS